MRSLYAEFNAEVVPGSCDACQCRDRTARFAECATLQNPQPSQGLKYWRDPTYLGVDPT